MKENTKNFCHDILHNISFPMRCDLDQDSTTAQGCSVGAILEALAELPDLDDAVPSRWPGPSDPDYQLSPTQPTVRRSEMAPAVRVKSLPP